MNELRNQIFHEQEMLHAWQSGDLSLLPEGWSIEQQIEFIKGMEHAEAILMTHKIYDDKVKDQAVDALNRLDELASFATADNDNDEGEQQQTDYEFLHAFISKDNNT